MYCSSCLSLSFDVALLLYSVVQFLDTSHSLLNFLPVTEDQHCELNCRAIGFRFYVRQSDKVIDGTPCGQNDTSLCVAGKCTVGHQTVFFFVMFRKRKYNVSIIVLIFCCWPLCRASLRLLVAENLFTYKLYSFGDLTQ